MKPVTPGVNRCGRRRWISLATAAVSFDARPGPPVVNAERRFPLGPYASGEFSPYFDRSGSNAANPLAHASKVRSEVTIVSRRRGIRSGSEPRAANPGMHVVADSIP